MIGVRHAADRPNARPWSSTPRGPLRRFIDRRRRTLAAALLCLAAGAAVHQLTPPSAAMVPVVVAARDLPAGAALGSTDLSLVRMPAEAVPSRSESDPGRVSGQRLAAPVRRGQPLTDASVVGPGLLAGAAPGTAAVPVRVADPASLQLVSPGQLIDLVLSPDTPGSSAALQLASRVPVLWTSGQGQTGAASAWIGPQDSEGLLVVAASDEQALRLAGASSRGRVFFVLVEAGKR